MLTLLMHLIYQLRGAEQRCVWGSRAVFADRVEFVEISDFSVF